MISKKYAATHTFMPSRVRPFETPWTVASHAPVSMGFSRQEYWSGLPFPPQGNLLNPGIRPKSPASPAVAGGFFTTAPLGKPSKVNKEHFPPTLPPPVVCLRKRERKRERFAKLIYSFA